MAWAREREGFQGGAAVAMRLDSPREGEGGSQEGPKGIQGGAAAAVRPDGTGEGEGRYQEGTEGV